MNIVPDRMSMSKRKGHLTRNHLHLQHTCKDLFLRFCLFWDAASMETGLPLSVFWLVHPPSTGSFWAQRNNLRWVAPGPENTDFHGSFGRRFEPSSFQMLKRTGETVILLRVEGGHLLSCLWIVVWGMLATREK